MLTELQCKNFQPQDKSYKKFDGGNLTGINTGI